MNFLLSSNTLAKKCQGLYTKIERKEKLCYLKLNDDFEPEFVIKRNESEDRWELVEKSTSKLRAYHLSEEPCEEIGSTWTIVTGSKTRKKAVLKFIEESEAPKKGKKRSYDDIDPLQKRSKNVKRPRVFGKKVSQECKPLVTKHQPATTKRVKILEDSPISTEPLACDLNTIDDELYVPEYVKDIISYLCTEESNYLPEADYIRKLQPHFSQKNRWSVLNWTNQICTKYEYTNATFHLAVNIFDRYLSMKTIQKEKLQLVGAVSLWLSSKYMEVSVSGMDDYIELCDQQFDENDMLSVEADIVNALDFQLTVPTILNFADRFGHIIKHMLRSDKQKRRLRPLINFFIEHCALIYDCVGKTPSLIAAAATYAAAVWLDRDFEWNRRLEKEIGYGVADMQKVVNLIKREIYERKRKHGDKRPHVHDKYKTKENEMVSLMRYAKSTS